MRLLRNYGIYRLPGHVRQVYVVRVGGAYLLYDPQDWELYPSKASSARANQKNAYQKTIPRRYCD